MKSETESLKHLSRRSFLGCIPAGVCSLAALSVLPATAVLTTATTGCDSATLKSYLNAALESAEKILALSSSSDSWYSTLTSAVSALEATESAWSASTATTAVISALDTVEAVLAVIPATETYSSLIALLVSAIEAILTTFVASSAKPVHIRALASSNPYRGRVPLRQPRHFQTQVGAYRAQWNEIATGLGLTQAKL